MESLGFTNGYPESITEWSGRHTLRRFEGHNIPTVLYRDDLSTFCPVCLKDEIYWRKLWSLRAYHVCTKHGCRMLNSCSRCGSTLGIKRSCLYRCATCDFDLRQTKPTTVANEILLATQRIFATTIDYRSLYLAATIFPTINKTFGDNIADTQKIELALLILYNQNKAVIELRKILQKIIFPRHPRIFCLPLLANKHTNIITNTALSQLNQTENPEKYNNNIYLSKLESSAILDMSIENFFDLLKSKKIQPSRKNPRNKISMLELLPLLKVNTEELRRITKIGRKTLEKGSFVNASKAAELLNTSLSIVSSLVKTKHLKAETTSIRGFIQYSIDVESIEIFKKNFIVTRDIAKRFFVKHQTINHKLNMLNVYPVSGPSIDGALTNIFKLSEIDALMNQAFSRSRALL
jgi:hypothetical protein